MANSTREALASFSFAAIVAAILGLLVSATASFLAPRIATNREIERKKQILITTTLMQPGARAKNASIERLYEERIAEKSVTISNGTLPLFLALDSAGNTSAICIPLAGPGLWGPIQGYLALDASGRRVLRISLYEHRETPGLGAAISESRWTSQWTGKFIVDESNQLTPVVVLKGEIDPLDPWQASHAVDGISGATITGNAVGRIVRKGLEDYLFYLEDTWHKN